MTLSRETRLMPYRPPARRARGGRSDGGPLDDPRGLGRSAETSLPCRPGAGRADPRGAFAARLSDRGIDADDGGALVWRLDALPAERSWQYVVRAAPRGSAPPSGSPRSVRRRLVGSPSRRRWRPPPEIRTVLRSILNEVVLISK